MSVRNTIFNTVATVGLLASFATPAFAGGFYEDIFPKDYDQRQAVKAQCTDAILKTIPNGYAWIDNTKKQPLQFASEKPIGVNSVRVLEMTKQSDACMVRIGDDMSHVDQLVAVESTNPDLRVTTLKAMLDFQKETGKTVKLSLYRDHAPDDGQTRVSFWAGGHQRALYSIEDSLTGVSQPVLDSLNSKKKLLNMSKDVQEFKDRADQNKLGSKRSVQAFACYL